MATVRAENDVYVRLREFLDGLPAGLPASESGMELEVLKALFTEEDAELVMQLRYFPEPPSVISGRWGIPEKDAADRLASLARRGLIMSIGGGDKAFYQAAQFLLGIYEYQVDVMDSEFAGLMEEFTEKYVEPNVEFQKNMLRQFRVVPIDAAVDSASAIAVYDQARSLVKKQKLAAVMPCICCKEQSLLDNCCDRTKDRCLTFGIGAQYIIDNEKGRRISIDEALDCIDMAERDAFVLVPSNSRDIVHICLCCGHCCGVLRVLRMSARPADAIRSAFQVRIDPKLCSACGTCVERCQMDAVIEGEDAMRVDASRCIGCGLCVSTCEQGAARLVERHGVTAVPANLLRDAIAACPRTAGSVSAS